MFQLMIKSILYFPAFFGLLRAKRYVSHIGMEADMDDLINEIKIVSKIYNINLSFEERDGISLGSNYGNGEVVIEKRLMGLELLKVFLHEIAHELINIRIGSVKIRLHGHFYDREWYMENIDKVKITGINELIYNERVVEFLAFLLSRLYFPELKTDLKLKHFDSYCNFKFSRDYLRKYNLINALDQYFSIPVTVSSCNTFSSDLSTTTTATTEKATIITI